jgi:NADH-quinone oxidoreductase subunit K
VRPTLEHYLVIGALLFGLGLFTVVTRRTTLGTFLGISLVLNAAALNFAAFDHFVAESHGPAGQVFALFIVTLAAGEAAVALALALKVQQAERATSRDELPEHRR